MSGKDKKRIEDWNPSDMINSGNYRLYMIVLVLIGAILIITLFFGEDLTFDGKLALKTFSPLPITYFLD